MAENEVTTPNAYEARLEARRERYLALAERARTASAASYDRVRRICEHIPFGQPILIGHHSERHARADQRRIENGMRASIEADNKASYYKQRAASVGTAGISSDDPEALDKIAAKVARLEQTQAIMKAANAIIRKHKCQPSAIPALVAAGLSETQAAKLLTPDFCGCVGFPTYSLSNNNANIRRLKDRITQLERLEAQRAAVETADASPVEIGGVRIMENFDANRLQIFFPAIPSEEIRKQLKSYGFRWCRTEGAWQRHLSTSAKYWAEQIAARYEVKGATNA